MQKIKRYFPSGGAISGFRIQLQMALLGRERERAKRVRYWLVISVRGVRRVIFFVRLFSSSSAKARVREKVNLSVGNGPATTEFKS